ncbi:MAG: YbbR-like domain-containing protein [Acidobacteriaceae bacterium]|nr:YbbR-like domain-containing protein [Acidobacteriaceae bacterium]
MRDFFERFVLHNIALKLIALAAAVLLWSAISREPTVEIAYSVPVEFHQVPQNLEITSEVIPQAQVRLRGPARRLRTIQPGDVHPVIDLSGAATGERTYDLTAQQVRVPYDVEVLQVIPSQVRLSFDRRQMREVKIKPRVTGTMTSGYDISKVICDPASILIVGPERRVSVVEAATTDPVDATGVIGHASFSTNAYVADPLVREVRPVLVKVTVYTQKPATQAASPEPPTSNQE